MIRNNFHRLSKKFIIALICFFLSTSAFAIQGYDFIDLGTLDGKFAKVGPSAINEVGQVVGTGKWWDSNGIYHSQAFFWDRIKGMVAIEGFGEIFGTAQDLNDLGQVVGYSDYPDGSRHAFLWENNVIYDLGIGWATGINNSGIVVGGGRSGAFMWDSINGRTNPFGNGDIRPLGINDLGQVVGTAFNQNDYLQAFIWDTVNGFQFIDMPTELQASVGSDINNFSQIAGHGDSITYPNYHHSYIWENTSVISTLGDLGGNQEWASGINNKGQIFGNATAPDFMKYGTGFIWDEINGMQNINDLIFFNEGLEYIASCDGNDSGEIIGRGFRNEENETNGIWHAFLLIPIPDELSIETILEFFDDSIANGTLTGDGPGKSGNNRLYALRNMLEMASDLINIDDIEGACLQLNAAIGKCDSDPSQPDFVIGSAVFDLYTMITELMEEIGCE